MSSDGSYGMFGVCKILLLMNVVDMDCLLCAWKAVE